MGAPMTPAEMVEELMTGLNIGAVIPEGQIAPRGERCWLLDDNDVVRLAQACVAQLGSLKADPGAAPLALQATIVRNAYAVADSCDLPANGSIDGSSMCPFPASDPMAEAWSSAFAARIRWIKSGRVVS